MAHPLFDLLTRLEAAGIPFRINRRRPDTILVSLASAGERIEIDVFADGYMEVTRFTGNEDVIGDEEWVEQYIQQYVQAENY